MITNYLVTAIRNAFSHKLYSTINILGLAVGLATFLLIILYVQYEHSYDGFLPNRERLYRLETSISPPGLGESHWAYGTGAAKGVLEFEIPGIQELNRFVYRKTSVRKDDRLFSENVMHADGNFFDVFQLPFIEGEPAQALLDESSIVLSRDMARKYFGATPALDQILTLDGNRDFRVSGILENLPQNSHMDLDMVVLFDSANFSLEYSEGWTNAIVYVFLLLQESVDIEPARSMLPSLVNKYLLSDLRLAGFDVDDANQIMSWNLINVEDIHLNGADMAAINPGGNPVTVTVFLAIAILVLSLAAINYTNLALARSLLRTREVSLRKVLGAGPRQIAGQFLSESILTALISLVLAFLITSQLVPSFSSFLNASFSFGRIFDPLFIGGLMLLVVAVGILSGLYPSFYLARIKPSKFLSSNKSSVSAKTSLFRLPLVIIQFAIAIGLLAGMTIIYQQTDFVRAFDPGFQRDGVLVVRNVDNPDVFASLETFHQRLLAHPDITNATIGIDLPSFQFENGTRFDIQTPSLPTGMVLQFHSVDYDFFQTFGIEAVAGRLFSEEFGQDLMRDYTSEGINNGSIIINEEATRQLGFESPADAIGIAYRMVGEFITGPVWVEGTVVGIVPDFHYRSVKDAISPAVFNVDRKTARSMAIRFDQDRQADVINFIDTTWLELFPDLPIAREFMTERMDVLYQSDVKDGKMLAIFSGLAIVLSALGLYGLAAFATEQRIKEIGIRKVMGASIFDILKLMIWQFSQPVLLANLIAWPLTWYFASDWLSGFIVRISINPLVLVGAGLAALLIAWATVFSRAYGVAQTNPIRALRHD